MYLKRVAHQEVADAFAASVPQNLKTLFSGPDIVAELLPLLNRIVAPDLKPVRLLYSLAQPHPLTLSFLACAGQQPSRQER